MHVLQVQRGSIRYSTTASPSRMHVPRLVSKAHTQSNLGQTRSNPHLFCQQRLQSRIQLLSNVLQQHRPAKLCTQNLKVCVRLGEHASHGLLNCGRQSCLREIETNLIQWNSTPPHALACTAFSSTRMKSPPWPGFRTWGTGRRVARAWLMHMTVCAPACTKYTSMFKRLQDIGGVECGLCRVGHCSALVRTPMTACAFSWVQAAASRPGGWGAELSR